MTVGGQDNAVSGLCGQIEVSVGRTGDVRAEAAEVSTPAVIITT
jgi:hypothetical protein